MLTRELIAQVLPVLVNVALLLIVRLWANSARRSGASQERVAHIEAIGHAAACAVAQVEATVVRDLKDPSKPGSWDKVGRESARDAAISLVRNFAGPAVGAMKADGADTLALLRSAVEKALLDRRALQPSAPAAAAATAATPATPPAAT